MELNLSGFHKLFIIQSEGWQYHGLVWYSF